MKGTVVFVVPGVVERERIFLIMVHLTAVGSARGISRHGVRGIVFIHPVDGRAFLHDDRRRRKREVLNGHVGRL